MAYNRVREDWFRNAAVRRMLRQTGVICLVDVVDHLSIVLFLQGTTHSTQAGRMTTRSSKIAACALAISAAMGATGSDAEETSGPSASPIEAALGNMTALERPGEAELPLFSTETNMFNAGL